MVFSQRRFPLRHFDSGYAQTPHVGLGIVSCLSNDFWCHPKGRPHKGMAKCVRELCGHTEICKLDFARRRKENVCCLDVSVNGSLRMEVIESQQKLATDDGDMSFREVSRLEKVKAR